MVSKKYFSRPVGWKGESHRHYLAAKGISTKPKMYAAGLAGRLLQRDFEAQDVRARSFPARIQNEEKKLMTRANMEAMSTIAEPKGKDGQLFSPAEKAKSTKELNELAERKKQIPFVTQIGGDRAKILLVAEKERIDIRNKQIEEFEKETGKVVDQRMKNNLVSRRKSVISALNKLNKGVSVTRTKGGLNENETTVIIQLAKEQMGMK